LSTVQQAPGQAVAPAWAEEWTETTRLLCAAAYLDGTFAQQVAEEIVDEPFRAVRVPEGVDIVPIVKHCLAARRQKTIRDLVLFVIFVLAIVLFYRRSGNVYYQESYHYNYLVLGFLLGWATIAADFWIATYGVARQRLNATSFRPQDAPQPIDAVAAAQIEELARRQHGNVVVYSGFNPFSSSGFDLDGWSFAIDLRKGRERLGNRAEPKPFEAREMYDAIAKCIARLGIPGLSIEDRIFVSGSDIRDDRVLLPDIAARPVADVGPETMEGFIRTPTHRVRHYRCFRVVDWRGELVVTLFLRFAVSNGRLFAELSRFVLPPLRPEFRRIDALAQESPLRQAFTLAQRSFWLTFPLGLRSLLTPVRPLLRIQRRAKSERQVRRDYFFDYGSRRSALDRARSTAYTRYFQKLDKEMYVKLFDRTLLDAIVDFLDEHDVETSELAERRETIINNGIMVPGGSVQAHNVAVGEGATIVDRLRGSVTKGKAT
jgi:hypothetical protein